MDRVMHGVSVEPTSDGYLIKTTENGVVTNRRLFSDKAKAKEYEDAEKRRLGFIR